MKQLYCCLLAVAFLVGCAGDPTASDAGRPRGKTSKHSRGRDAGDGDASEPDATSDRDAAPSDMRQDGPVARENRFPGSDGLELTKIATDQLAAYASTVSAAAGETVALHVNVDAEQEVRWELFRIGDYQGRGARRVASADPARVGVQAGCPPDPRTGLVECNWAAAFRVPIRREWVSGYYAFKLTNAAGYQSYVPLIVRDDARRAPIQIQASVNTWQAYNRWGGTSLYRNLTNHEVFTGARATRVSFDRPYDAAASLFFKELPLVRWLER